jgi:hypothetical protein
MKQAFYENRAKTFSYCRCVTFIPVSAGTILQFTFLPGLVQKKIIAELNKSGFPDVQVKVKSVTYRNAELEM